MVHAGVIRYNKRSKKIERSKKKEILTKIVVRFPNKKLIEKRFKICPICNTIFEAEHSKRVYCSYKCNNIGQRKVERPDKKTLSMLIDNMSLSEIARRYRVSLSAVRKWILRYGINKTSAGCSSV